jgi:lipid-binding SYLF domain-containing protein
MTDSESIRLLRSIDRRLALLSGAENRRMRARVVADLLRAPGRTAMFDAIDGQRGSSEIAKAAKVSERAAQLFVKELLDLGLVKVIAGATGRGVLVARDDDALLAWYLERITGDVK